jgi:hypothetical protein
VIIIQICSGEYISEWKGLQINMKEVAKVIPIVISKLKRLGMHLPPPHIFDELLGCYGNRRFFALSWSRAVRAPILHDGFLETLGDPDPYRVWRYHPGVIDALAGYNIGDAAETADHWLLVDRKSRALYIGAVADVLVVLDYQKRGVIDPLKETGPDRKVGDSMDIQREGAVVPAKRYKKPMFSNMKLMHELEMWLNTNVADS